eukprot:evm.model.scf_1704.1 EVM.evm.TU.scf_1704.1   scf_1704:4162-7371(-)
MRRLLSPKSWGCGGQLPRIAEAAEASGKKSKKSGEGGEEKGEKGEKIGAGDEMGAGGHGGVAGSGGSPEAGCGTEVFCVQALDGEWRQRSPTLALEVGQEGIRLLRWEGRDALAVF